MSLFSLLAPLALIFCSLCLGYLYRRKKLAQSTPEAAIDHLRDQLQFWAFFLLMPLSAMLSLWGLANPRASLAFFPLLGLCTWMLGGFFAYIFARFFRLSRSETGSIFCCGAFSNIGAIGTLVCVFLFGEKSIAYAALFRLLEECFYYGIAIPIASRFTEKKDAKVTIQGIRISKLLAIILIALAFGIALNRFGIARPPVFGTISAIASVLACVLALFSIGLGLRFSYISHYPKACTIICAVKFMMLPSIITLAAYIMGYGDMDSALPLKIAFVLSSMPVAMNALLPPALLKLDLDLANACWLVSTLALFLVIPWLSFVVHTFL